MRRLAVGILVAGCTLGPVLGLTAVVPDGGSAAAAPACPAGSSCVSLPDPCPTASCPTAVVNPTTGISDSSLSDPERVFVNLSGFTPGQVVTVYYCSDATPLATAPPECLTAPAPVSAPIFSDGTASVSQAAPEDEDDGNAPLQGQVPGSSTTGTFYCDNSAHPCSLDVVDPSLNHSRVPSPANTMVVPVSFLPDSTGCPTGTVLNTVSDFGIEGLLEMIAPATCRGAHPAVALDTAQDSLAAVRALASGTATVAFTDDPQATDEQAALAGKHPVFIPVAASADVLGFLADVTSTSDPHLPPFTQAAYSLTPAMVAGLVADVDSDAGSADLLGPGVSCEQPGPPAGAVSPCPAMQVLNQLPGFASPTSYGVYLRADNAGVTDELLSWLCQAPDHTVTIAGQTLPEPQTAAQVLTSAANWAQPLPHGACPQTDQFPAVAQESGWGTGPTPADQFKLLFGQYLQPDPPRQADFATMNWSEALHLGLDVASLQNAAGQMVAPSAASIDAALAAATSNGDGTLTPDYADTTATSAYPMPVVIYAAVLPSTEDNTTRAAVSQVLTTALSAGSSAAGLPQGLVALPPSLAHQAAADVATDLAPVPAAKHPTAAGKGPGPAGTTDGCACSTWSPSTYAEDTAAFRTAARLLHAGEPDAAKAPASTHRSPGLVAQFAALVQPEGRWLLVTLLTVAAGALVVGPTLLAVQRRRLQAGAAPDAVTESGDHPDPPPPPEADGDA